MAARPLSSGGMVHLTRRRASARGKGEPLQPRKSPSWQAALARTLRGAPSSRETGRRRSPWWLPDFPPAWRTTCAAPRPPGKRKGGVHRLERPLDRGWRHAVYRTERVCSRPSSSRRWALANTAFSASHVSGICALLAYASSWLMRHEPACFWRRCSTLLPMGFYSASQLVQDARRHGACACRSIDADRERHRLHAEGNS